MHLTSPHQKHYARRMRHEPTPEENRLWQSLRGRRFGDCKFRRQYPIGSYILDFYCRELKFAIELDGAFHEEQAAHDEQRSAELAAYGITILRITNRELKREPRLVEERIKAMIATLRG